MHVTDKLVENGTTIHWHGMYIAAPSDLENMLRDFGLSDYNLALIRLIGVRQLHTNDADGVNGMRLQKKSRSIF